LRSDASTKHIPVVVISANLDAERMAFRNSTLFSNIEWLQKPQTGTSIINAVKAVIAN